MINKLQTIGLFDSGIGGLGIARKIRKLLPNENLVYLADSKNCPYGTKPISQIQNICAENVETLINKYHSKMIVIACNTATVSAIDYLRRKYKTVPIVGVVPVIKTAVGKTKTGKITVMSTPNTIKSQAYKNLLKKFASGVEVISISCPGLAEAIEHKLPKKEINAIVRNFLKPFGETGYDVLALGCTHYTLIKQDIKKIVGENVEVIDSNGAVARHVKRVLAKEKLLATSKGRGEIHII